jgi:DNA-binding Lrp family transcriptional regulator
MPRQTLSLVPDAPIPSIDPELFYQTPNDFAMKAIRAKLTGADWCLWSYLQMLDSHGDRMKPIPNPQEIAEIIGISSKQVKRSLAKLEELGLYEIRILQMEGRNLAGAAVRERRTKLSVADKVVSQRTKLSSSGQSCPAENEIVQPKTGLSQSSPETVTEQGFQTPHTLNTYSYLLNTLSEGMRESFEKFCLKKIEECSFKIGSRKAWLNKHGEEYLEEFNELYAYAISNPEVIAPKAEIATPTIEQLKQQYGPDWKNAAIHFGLISPNSPQVENQENQEVNPSW